jgi:hypothetical protein
VIGELRMPFRRLFPSKPIALSPYLYGSYRPPKQRWWPLFACLGRVGFSCFRYSDHRSSPTAPTQRDNLSYTQSLDHS